MLAHPANLAPRPLSRRRDPFDSPDWVFELKYDGFRALAILDHGRAKLVSRNGNVFASFADLADSIAASLPDIQDAVLDGEIVCLDAGGRPNFRDLLFRHAEPVFVVFDLLLAQQVDLRLSSLVERKAELRRVLGRGKPGPILYFDPQSIVLIAR